MSAHTDADHLPSSGRGSVHTDHRMPFFVLADAIGHTANGATSRLAVETLQQTLRYQRRWQLFRRSRRDTEKILDRMTRAVHTAHDVLLAHSRSEASNEDEGCTIVAGSIEGGYCDCVAVGDSRLYRFSNGQLAQITRHQSLAGQSLEEGFLEPGDERPSSYDHTLSAAVGGRIKPTIQQYRVPFRQGDLLLACSDSLCEVLSDARIASLLKRPGNTDELAARLVEKTRMAGATNNVSVILVGHHEPNPPLQTGSIHWGWEQACRISA